MQKLLLLIISLSTSTLIYSQCTVSASGFGNNTNTPSYNISGDVSVTLNPDNTISLDLGTNFQTANGPDIRAYLINSNGRSNTELQNTEISDLENIFFGLVGCGFGRCNPEISPNGAKSFTVAIPNDQNIENYDKVFFYCLEFNAFWDVGDFTPFTSANCAVLNLNTVFNSKDFVTYPNPVDDILTIENNKELELNTTVFNVLGKEVLKINSTKKALIKINLSTLNAGVYLLQTKHKDVTLTKRIIKQ